MIHSTFFGHFGTSDDEIIRIRIFLRNRAIEAVEASEVAEAAKVNEAAEN